MKISRRRFGSLALTAAGSMLMAGNIAASSRELLHRAIPSSGEKIPVIGLGTNRYRSDNIASLTEPLRRFHALGGRFVDTAPAYRSSEEALGKIAGKLEITDDLLWATKVDRGTTEELDEQFATSSSRLDTAPIDVLQVHNLRSWQTSLTRLQEWKAAGRVRYVGVTTSRESQFDEVAKILRTAKLDFVQLNYSLEARSAAEELIPLAADRGVAVIVNRALGGGRLFKAVGDAPLPGWAAEFDCESWAQFLLKYVLANPAVTCVIPGMTKVKHVEDNLAAGLGRLPDEAMRRRQQGFFESL